MTAPAGQAAAPGPGRSGFAWLDGALAAWWRRLLPCLTGLAGPLGVVVNGPYPVSMVGVDTSTVTNTYPPRVTLLPGQTLHNDQVRRVSTTGFEPGLFLL